MFCTLCENGRAQLFQHLICIYNEKDHKMDRSAFKKEAFLVEERAGVNYRSINIHHTFFSRVHFTVPID
jgi:hypothetical protein